MQNKNGEVTTPQQRQYKSFILIGIEFSYEFIKTTLLVIVVALIFRYFLVQPFIVVGQSMEPNFHNNEYLVVDKLSYKLRVPRRGEVIIFHPPANTRESYIKRIIGLPGERVEVKEGNIYIDGRLLEESYVQRDPKISEGRNDLTAQLGPNEYFVFGDNRDHSSDSREIGPIPKANIQGKVMLILFPIKNMRTITTPTYLISKAGEITSMCHPEEFRLSSIVNDVRISIVGNKERDPSTLVGMT